MNNSNIDFQSPTAGTTAQYAVYPMPLTTTDAYAADMFGAGIHYQPDMIEAAAQAEVGFDSVCCTLNK